MVLASVIVNIGKVDLTNVYNLGLGHQPCVAFDERGEYIAFVWLQTPPGFPCSVSGAKHLSPISFYSVVDQHALWGMGGNMINSSVILMSIVILSDVVAH